MKPAFLVWLKATLQKDARIKRQYASNLPKGIV
jgi:hypothetical protein